MIDQSRFDETSGEFRSCHGRTHVTKLGYVVAVLFPIFAFIQLVHFGTNALGGSQTEDGVNNKTEKDNGTTDLPPSYQYDMPHLFSYSPVLQMILMVLDDVVISVLSFIGLRRHHHRCLLIAVILVGVPIVEVVGHLVRSTISGHLRWSAVIFVYALSVGWLSLLLWCVWVLWRCVRYEEAREMAQRLASATVDFDVMHAAVEDDDAFLRSFFSGGGSGQATETSRVNLTSNTAVFI